MKTGEFYKDADGEVWLITSDEDAICVYSEFAQSLVGGTLKSDKVLTRFGPLVRVKASFNIH